MDRNAVCAALTACLVAAGCSQKPRIAVGSKNFTEQAILGEIAAQQIERRLGARVDRRLSVGGTLLAFQALRDAQIDLYPEYTGAAYVSLLHHEDFTTPEAVLDQVRAEFATSMQLRWMAPLGFDDGFAMVVTAAKARAAHLETLSDAVKQPGWTLGCGYEFLERPDGFRALLTKYPDMQFTAGPSGMELGLLYRALTQGKVSMAAGDTTDAALTDPGFVALRDDQHAFPPYQASYVVRFDTLARVPGLEAALGELSGKIPADAMRAMNAEVDRNHRPPAAVAAEFLKTIP